MEKWVFNEFVRDGCFVPGSWLVSAAELGLLASLLPE